MSTSYRLLGRIETGALAELYEALQEPGGTQAVIKLFHEKTSDPRYAAVLARTYGALGALRHEGLVPLLDLGFVQGRLAVVREAVTGHTLGTVLQRLHAREVLLPPLLALSLLLQLLEAVQLAHEAGVVHGALTPGNVLLSRAGVPSIADFGALQALLEVPRLERTFAARGRSAYRAPELGRGEPPTAQADVYSLGAIAYELLTRRQALLPESGGSARAAGLPPPSRLDRRIPAKVDPLILRALEASPSRRFRSCAEFATALRNVLAAQGGVPGAEELRRFLAELLPPQASSPGASGPLPFTERFTLTPVSTASLAQVSDDALEKSVVARPAYSPTLEVEEPVGQLPSDTLRDLPAAPTAQAGKAPATWPEFLPEPPTSPGSVLAAGASVPSPTLETPRAGAALYRRNAGVGLTVGAVVGLGVFLWVSTQQPREVLETPVTHEGGPPASEGDGASASLQPAEVDARNEGLAYLTLRTSLAVQVTIDGVRVNQPLPLVRYPVKPGYRRIVVETLDRTRRREVFELHFGRGQHRQVEPF
jgi:serine/threonine-protein kinase